MCLDVYDSFKWCLCSVFLSLFMHKQQKPHQPPTCVMISNGMLIFCHFHQISPTSRTSSASWCNLFQNFICWVFVEKSSSTSNIWVEVLQHKPCSWRCYMRRKSEQQSNKRMGLQVHMLCYTMTTMVYMDTCAQCSRETNFRYSTRNAQYVFFIVFHWKINPKQTMKIGHFLLDAVLQCVILYDFAI